MLCALGLSAAGCMTVYTASGRHAPPRPPERLYEGTTLPVADVSSVRVAPVGVRTREHWRRPFVTDRDVYVDVLLASRSLELLKEAAARFEHGVATGGWEPLVQLQTESGEVIKLTGWRRAMHERSSSMAHFSVLASNTITDLPEADDVHRCVATLSFKARPFPEPGAARCSLIREALAEELRPWEGTDPITWDIDPDQQLVQIRRERDIEQETAAMAAARSE